MANSFLGHKIQKDLQGFHILHRTVPTHLECIDISPLSHVKVLNYLKKKYQMTPCNHVKLSQKLRIRCPAGLNG